MKNLLGSVRMSAVGKCLAAGLVALAVAGCQSTNDNISFSSAPVSFYDTPTPATSALTNQPLQSTPPTQDGQSVPPLGDILLDSARISKGDGIKVTFSGISIAIPPHEEQVKDDGTLTLPYIGSIQAEGKTPGELQKEIHDKYVPDYYARLTVTVSTDRQVYYVLGQVRAPNRQAYIGPTSVLKAIASANDFTDFADRRRVVLTRADGTRIVVDCIKAARDASFDLPVFPGDKIEVPQRSPFGGWWPW